MDESDRLIVECLREDGRMALSEISRRTSITEPTVRRRIQRMVDKRILRIVPVVDPERIGLRTSVLVGLRVDPPRVSAVADEVASLTQVRFVALTTGPFDVFVEAFVGSQEQLAHLLLERIANIAGVVATEAFSVLRVAKFAYEWEVPSSLGHSADGIPGHEADGIHP